MKLKFNQNLYQYLLLTKRDRGFTLIELLVVVIIIGVLAAVALPSLLSQVGKARETEAKNNLGILSRAQIAYHYEAQTFFNGNNIASFADVNLANSYYNITGDTSANDTQALHTAYATDPVNSQARDFAAGIYFNAPIYSTTICVANGVDNDGTTSSVNAQANGSCDSGSIIK